MKDLIEQKLNEDFRSRLAPIYDDYVMEMRRRTAEQRGAADHPPFLVATIGAKLDSETNLVVMQRVLTFPFEVCGRMDPHARTTLSVSTQLTKRRLTSILYRTTPTPTFPLTSYKKVRNSPRLLPSRFSHHP